MVDVATLQYKLVAVINNGKKILPGIQKACHGKKTRMKFQGALLLHAVTVKQKTGTWHSW